MLVLSRKVNQAIRIGDDILIVVVGFNKEHNQVSLGIEAPKDIRISRLGSVSVKNKAD